MDVLSVIFTTTALVQREDTYVTRFAFGKISKVDFSTFPMRTTSAADAAAPRRIHAALHIRKPCVPLYLHQDQYMCGAPSLFSPGCSADLASIHQSCTVLGFSRGHATKTMSE